MISIIISYYKETNYSNVCKNISETCGFPNEIVGVYNPKLYNIAKAYNLGAEKAKHPYLLFLHDDVLFKTNNWGKIFTKHLADENTGVIGIAGSNYVPKAPSGWFIHKKAREGGIKSKAIALDGVFLGISKKHFDELSFDEQIDGFHGYDTDISLRAAKKHQNYVITDILIDHFSSGNPDKIWFENNILIRNKNGHLFQNDFDKELETEAFERFLRDYFKYVPNAKFKILKILKYYPLKIGFKNHFKFLKLYLQHLKHY